MLFIWLLSVSPIFIFLAGCAESRRIDDFDASVDGPEAGVEDSEGGVDGYKVKDLSSRVSHSCVASETGQVRCWGDNQSGQLGDGTTTPRSTPVLVPDLTATKVVTGMEHTCALLESGEVACWGSNLYGEAGVPGITRVLSPVQVVGLRDVVALAAGSDHTCALTRTGDIECFGMANAPNGLGYGNGRDGNTGPTPFRMPRIEGVVALRAGSHVTCALTENHVARCWGMNPVAGESANEFTLGGDVRDLALSEGGFYCLVDGKGRVFCGGREARAVEGILSDSSDGSLQQVPGLANVVDLAASAFGVGGAGVCARDVEGSVFCWGGLGSATTPTEPKRIGNIKAEQVSVGADFGCAVVDKGVRCWGDRHTRRGDGESVFEVEPETINGVNDATQVSTGLNTNCARLRDGQVSCWGFGLPGEPPNSRTPQQARILEGITDAQEVAIGAECGCIRRKNGEVLCFFYGLIESAAPKKLSVIEELAHAQTISAHVDSSARSSVCALSDERIVRCVSLWGSSESDRAELRDPWPTWPDSSLTTVSFSYAINSVHHGVGCIVDTNGEMACFGTGIDAAALLDRPDSESPNDVLPLAALPSIDTVRDVAISQRRICVVTQEGRVLCWGDPTNHMLGIDSDNFVATPTDIGLEDAVQISTSVDHTCAVHESGRLSCWGRNQVGQLGNGMTEESSGPVEVVGIADAVQVSVALETSCAVKRDGNVVCWGSGLPSTWPDPNDAGTIFTVL